MGATLIGCSLPCSTVDEQLLFQQEILGDDRSATTRLEEHYQSGEQVENQENDIFHTIQG